MNQAQPSTGEKRRYRVLLVVSHPIQYLAPVFRLLAQDPRLDVTVAYCTLQGAEPGVDPEFGVTVSWDVPLLDGYKWVHVPNRSPRPGLGRFLGLINPGLWKLVRRGRFDAVVAGGYGFLSYWIAIVAAKFAGIPVLVVTDAIAVESHRGGWWWKRWVKPRGARWIYGFFDGVLVRSTPSRDFIHWLGVPEERITLSAYVVDNDYFARASSQADRAGVRSGWDIPLDSTVFLFCAKLVPWKRPADLLRAFTLLTPSRRESAYVVFAGDGPLRQELEALAASRGIARNVRFLGFVNQSELPRVYAASDLLVLPSEHEAWGVVVNEAMACGVPVITSDRVGAHRDLITSGVNGEVYRVGDLTHLARALEQVVEDPGVLKRWGEAARRRMETWSLRECAEGYVAAVEKAMRGAKGVLG